MQLAAGALQNRTTYEEPVQTDGSKMRAHAHVIKENRSARFGLPCANCKAYYASDLPSCPICKSAERVPAEEAEAESADTLKKPSAVLLQGSPGSLIPFYSTPAFESPN